MGLDCRRKDKIKDSVKTCKQCGKYLSELYNGDICPICKEINLFSEVKEYIRANDDVHEADVAEYFGIPVSKVHSWIAEGRIQYRISGGRGKTVSGVYCQICGKSLDFGTICPECRRLKKLQVVAKRYSEDKKGVMHFLGKQDGE